MRNQSTTAAAIPTAEPKRLAFFERYLMARDLEVSLRTMKRDIEYMQDMINLPIEYDRQRHGFYYTRPVEHFPSMAMTEAETFALLVAHKAIEQYHGTLFQKSEDGR